MIRSQTRWILSRWGPPLQCHAARQQHVVLHSAGGAWLSLQPHQQQTFPHECPVRAQPWTEGFLLVGKFSSRLQ